MINWEHRVTNVEDIRISPIDGFVPTSEVLFLVFREWNLLVHLVDDGTLDQLSFGSFSLFENVLLVRKVLVYKIWVDIVDEF